MEQAVAIALQRNRDVIAARLEIEAAQLDVVAARIYPNPVFSYALGNLVLGAGNPQTRRRRPGRPRLLRQPVQSVGVSEVIDVWAKRSARMRAAERGRRAPAPPGRGRAARDRLRRALGLRRRGARAVRARSSPARSRDRYDETIRLSQARVPRRRHLRGRAAQDRARGAASYQNDGHRRRDGARPRARSKLAALLGLAVGARAARRAGRRARRRAADARSPAPGRGRRSSSGPTCARRARRAPQAEAALDAGQARGAARHLAGRGLHAQRLHGLGRQPQHARPRRCRCRCRSSIATRPTSAAPSSTSAAPTTTASACASPSCATHEVARGRRGARPSEAPRRVLGRCSRTAQGGMLERAETALRVAEKSYKAGAISLLELLEAQRTYLDTRAQYLRALHDYRQAAVDVDPRRGRSPGESETQSRSPSWFGSLPRCGSAPRAAARARGEDQPRRRRAGRATSSRSIPATPALDFIKIETVEESDAARRSRSPGG